MGVGGVEEGNRVNSFLLDDVQLAEIIQWLLNREEDIARDIEDFGSLKTLFFLIVGREAEEEI